MFKMKMESLHGNIDCNVVGFDSRSFIHSSSIPIFFGLLQTTKLTVENANKYII